MRFAVIVFSLLLVFTPVYSYAFFWFGAGAVKGMIARTGLGQFVKINSRRAFAGSVMWGGAQMTEKSLNVVKSYCKKTKKCDDILDAVSLSDDTPQETETLQCTISYNREILTSSDPQNLCEQWLVKANQHVAKSYPNKSFKFADSITAKVNTINDGGYCAVYGGMQKFTGNNAGVFRCETKKIEINNSQETEINITKEQIQRIVNNMSDDDITYIINNYGDDIEVEKYCSEDSCDELSNEFGQEVQNNQNKYDIDQINKANCVVENSKIVSCDNAKIKQDEETEETTEENKEQETQETTEDKKINCEASEFHQKVCDFIDWYQDDFEHDNTDTGVNVDDKSDDLPKRKDYVKFNAQCPPDKIINLSFAGVNKSLNWTYQDFCSAMIELKPFVVGFSLITGAFIVSGRRV